MYGQRLHRHRDPPGVPVVPADALQISERRALRLRRRRRRGAPPRGRGRASTAATGSRSPRASRPARRWWSRASRPLRGRQGARAARRRPAHDAKARTAVRRPRRSTRAARTGRAATSADDVAHPARAAEPRLHPDDVADGASPSAPSSLVAALGRSLSRRSTSRWCASRPSIRAPARTTSRSPSPSPSSARSRPRRASTAWRASSKQGVCIVTCWFQYGTNLDNAQFEVRAAHRADPEHAPAGHPAAHSSSSSTSPTSRSRRSPCAARGSTSGSSTTSRTTPSSRSSSASPGVASAAVGGGKTREIEVKAQRDALRARNLDILDVVARGAAARTCSCPSGHLRSPATATTTSSRTRRSTPRGRSRASSLRPGNGGARGRRHAAARLGDVAHVVDATADQDDIVRINGRRGVYLRVLKQPGANTIGVVDALRTQLQHLLGVPQNVNLDISFDQSSYIRAAVKVAGARGRAGRRARDRSSSCLPREPARHGHRERRHPALDRRDVRAALLHRPDAERVHARRAGARRGPARRRLHRRAREHPPTPRPGTEQQERRAQRGPGSGDAHPRLDDHDHRRLLPGALPPRRRAATSSSRSRSRSPSR